MNENLWQCVFMKAKDGEDSSDFHNDRKITVLCDTCVSLIDMYAEVKFKNGLKNVDEVEDICLPEAVHGEPKKLLLQQLPGCNHKRFTLYFINFVLLCFFFYYHCVGILHIYMENKEVASVGQRW